MWVEQRLELMHHRALTRPQTPLCALPAGFCVNIIPELMLAEFGERAIVIGTSFDCVAAIVSFGTVPLVGALSDHFGRRSMLTLCLVLLSLPVVPLVLSMSLWFNLALRILAGVRSVWASNTSLGVVAAILLRL